MYDISVSNMCSNRQLLELIFIFIFLIQEIPLANGFICEDHDLDTNINFNTILKICELYQTEIQDKGDIGPYDILILKEKISNVLLKISSLSNNSDFINNSENFIEDVIAYFNPSCVYSTNSDFEFAKRLTKSIPYKKVLPKITNQTFLSHRSGELIIIHDLSLLSWIKEVSKKFFCHFVVLEKLKLNLLFSLL